MSPSRSWVLALTLLPALAPAPAWSAEQTIFETVKGWEVERGNTSADVCLMTYSYLDKNDNDARNSVVFAIEGANVLIALGYERWAFDKDRTIRAPFVIGKKVINAKSTWVGDGSVLQSSFPATIVPQLMAAKTIGARINDAVAEFNIPNFAPAYESLRRCNAAPPPSNAAQAPANASQAPGDAAQAPGNAAQAPGNAAQIPGNVSQALGNVFRTLGTAPQTAEGPKPGPAAPAAQPLAIAKLQFVTRPADKFGDIAARSSNAFPAGEKMRTYLEVTGQTIRPAASGQRKFGLRLDYEVLAGDRVLAGQKGLVDHDFTLDAQAPPVPTMYFDLDLSLTGLEPGAYTLAYTLHDKLDGRTATGSLPFASIPAPTPSSPAQLKAYFAGLMYQRGIKDCDVATTARQRSALDAKVAAFDPQPATAAEEIRTHAAADKPNCPDTPEKEAKFRTHLGHYLEMSTDAFVAWMDKQFAEQEAQAPPKQTAPGQTAPGQTTPAPADDATLCTAKDAEPSGRVEACSRALAARTLTDADRIALLLARADAQFDARNLDGAIMDYDAILAKVPDQFVALRVRGLLHYLKRDFDKALADTNAALRLEPKDASILVDRGSTYAEMGRTDEALADYDQSILIAPSAGAHARRARIRAAKGETERAIADLDEAIRLDPSESGYRDARAKLVAGQGKGQEKGQKKEQETAGGDGKL